MEIKQVLGLDVGHKRTGIARGSSAARLAEPLLTVETAKLIDKLKEIIRSESVDILVIGLPRNLSGDDTAQTRWVRDWVDMAKKQLKDVIFYWQDEALTSKLAEAKKLELSKNYEIDSLAAAIILQDFLDTPEAERVVC